ncbi:hypothetical protein B0H14DRAFT_3096449 [Mycena olivaceomarginata]|nr:hypothetical protein B0H14DRAFT_3096449 [Mycena olivaceomarginata]
MRGDRGGENIEVAVWMIKHRGAKRASFMWGSSTRNTRIERLWVEVGTQFARRWRAFFTRLERLHCLEHDSPRHLWLLHHLFLDDINSDCHDFQQEWNLHPLSGTQNKGQSPSDIRFISQSENGIQEDQPGVHPDILEEFYGTQEDRDDGEWENIDDWIAGDQADDVRHAAIKVPDHRSPFSAAMQTLFFDSLKALQDEGAVPEGYGLTPEELDGNAYPTCESIHLGRGGKKISIILPVDIWWRRAVLWAQGLELIEIES